MSERRLLFFGVMALTACGARPPSPPPPSQATLTLGGRDADGHFVPLNDGQDVTLVAGAQGGFHVWLKYRLTGMPEATATLERTAHRLADEQLVLRTRGVVDVGAPGAEGFWEPVEAIPMFMCPSPIGLSVRDQPIVFELDFPDERLHQQVTLVPHCPSGDQAFCERSCSG